MVATIHVEITEGNNGTQTRSLALPAPASDATARGRSSRRPFDTGKGVARTTDGKNEDQCSRGREGERAEGSDAGVMKAVMDAAMELGRESFIPGIREAAALVSMLVELVSVHQCRTRMVESILRCCLAVIPGLQRAAKVLGQVSSKPR